MSAQLPQRNGGIALQQAEIVSRALLPRQHPGVPEVQPGLRTSVKGKKVPHAG
jgi:hypothetical protein